MWPEADIQATSQRGPFLTKALRFSWCLRGLTGLILLAWITITSPLLLTRLLYESDDPQATLAEITRVVEVLEAALTEAENAQEKAPPKRGYFIN